MTNRLLPNDLATVNVFKSALIPGCTAWCVSKEVWMKNWYRPLQSDSLKASCYREREALHRIRLSALVAQMKMLEQECGWSARKLQNVFQADFFAREDPLTGIGRTAAIFGAILIDQLNSLLQSVTSAETHSGRMKISIKRCLASYLRMYIILETLSERQQCVNFPTSMPITRFSWILPFTWEIESVWTTGI